MKSTEFVLVFRWTVLSVKSVFAPHGAAGFSDDCTQGVPGSFSSTINGHGGLDSNVSVKLVRYKMERRGQCATAKRVQRGTFSQNGTAMRGIRYGFLMEMNLFENFFFWKKTTVRFFDQRHEFQASDKEWHEPAKKHLDGRFRRCQNGFDAN